MSWSDNACDNKEILDTKFDDQESILGVLLLFVSNNEEDKVNATKALKPANYKKTNLQEKLLINATTWRWRKMEIS